MSHRIRLLTLSSVMFLCLSVAVSGCAGLAGAGSDSEPTPTQSVTPSAGTLVAPSASPTPVSTPPEAAGCPSNSGSIPAGADTATIEDVDGDGRPDIQYFSESPTFEYGIQTASGATVSLPDDNAGPGRHSGWSAPLESGVVVTVLDDSRMASLHAFVDCAFVTTRGVDGNAYRFTLNGFGDHGTGVDCSNGNGGRQLLGILATRDSGGLYEITHTVVSVDREGVLATNGSPSAGDGGLAATDPQVVLAMKSRCGDIPTVQTSGR